MQPLEELPFVAGSPALDFVNTAEERGHPLCGDVLRDADDLRIWGSRYGIIDATASSEDGASEFARAIEARELLYRLALSRVEGAVDGPRDLRRLERLAADAYDAGRLQPAKQTPLDWHWDRSELASVRHIAVTSAVQLLAAPTSPRLKQCPGDHCGWFFLDTTKRGNRRWCRMSECGQAAKSASRRERTAKA